MKPALAILITGFVVCAAAYCGFYVIGTASHREMLNEQTPELAWLKKEFQLSDAELTRITKLHEAYQPHCREMCRRIDEQTDRLKKLLASANAMTPEIEATIAESGRLRAECHRDMMRHFFQVSQTMPPEQGRRYLTWITKRTFLPAHSIGMEQH
jgi:Spy/CpxP family protein refolding chaperone